MLVQIKFTCTDEFGSWQSERAGFADNDTDAVQWANDAIRYERERWSDTDFSNIVLIQPDLNGFNDRFISRIN